MTISHGLCAIGNSIDNRMVQDSQTAVSLGKD